MPSAKPILNFIVDRALLRKLDDFRFTHRFSTRAAAVKWLIEYALRAGPKPRTGGNGRPAGR